MNNHGLQRKLILGIEHLHVLNGTESVTFKMVHLIIKYFVLLSLTVSHLIVMCAEYLLLSSMVSVDS